jgi:hypothetical protein
LDWENQARFAAMNIGQHRIDRAISQGASRAGLAISVAVFQSCE